MGIFSRIINIAKSNSNSKNENYFVSTEIENDDDELKKIIEDLNSSDEFNENVYKKKSNNSNAYTVLEIAQNATETEINEAFKNKLKMFHPDKHPNSSKEEKEFFMKKTTEIIEAYNSIKN